MDGNGKRLRVVAHGPAADGEQEVRLVRPRDRDALVQLVQRRVGHDARDLRHVLAVLPEDLDHLVIDAVPFDGAAAVHEHDVFAVLGKFVIQKMQRIGAEIQLCGVAVGKIAQHGMSLLDRMNLF